MLRTKQFGSSLHNISKKRQAELASGAWKPKPRKPLRQMSKKTRLRVKNYRQATFEQWGYKCFLCGRVDETGKTLDCHHIFGRTNGDTDIVPLCNRHTGCKAHNHNAHDARFYELQKQILTKMKGETINGTNNT
jgi:predicted restriction endonuclease